MPTRMVTIVHRPKRPPRKRKAPAVGPAIVKATRWAPEDTPPVADESEPTPPPANDDTPAEPTPPAAKSAIVTATSRKRARLHRAEPATLSDDPEADAPVRAFLKRMVRPDGALPPEHP